MAAAQPIRIVEYREKWPVIFSELRDRLSLCLRSLYQAIKHVGSTSVPGLAGKDKVDIDIVIESAALLPDITERLAPLDTGTAATLASRAVKSSTRQGILSTISTSAPLEPCRYAIT